MNVEKNMNKAIMRMLKECENSPPKLRSYLIKCREMLCKYLLDQNGICERDIELMARYLDIDEELLRDRAKMSQEAAFYITFIDTLLLLASSVPYRRSCFLLVLIMCAKLRKSKGPIRWSEAQINTLFSSTYRYKMCIETVRAYHGSGGTYGFSVCPRCNCTLEREYQSYCDRCGQALDWKTLKKAKVCFGKSTGFEL